MGKPAATDRPRLTPLSHSFTLDFVITGHSEELLQTTVKPLVESFLLERGLVLSPEKTVITHVRDGFDFLGQNVRRYPNLFTSEWSMTRCLPLLACGIDGKTTAGT